MKTRALNAAIALVVAGCGPVGEPGASATAQPSTPAAPTAAEADAFVARAEKEEAELYQYASRSAWVFNTYTTEDTAWLNSRADAESTRLSVRHAHEAARFDKVAGLSADTRRKLGILKSSIVLPAPQAAGASDELSTLSTRLQSTYINGKGTSHGEPKAGVELENLMQTERDPEVLKEMWTSWHAIAAPMRADYTHMIELSNQGARELGFADAGAMWRSNYDMPPADFVAMTDRLFDEVKPLYDSLHCYARRKLNERYGDAVQAKTGPIRADLLGNMWAQQWDAIYEVVAPEGVGDIGYDIGALLKQKGYDAVRIMRTGEGFFTSLGFAPLPETFWTRSMIVQPQDHAAQCHASAWDIDTKVDLRIKMCTNVNSKDFVTVHHELGHNFYQRAYKDQPFLYLTSANDGFHEAIGDTIALSVTPDYLVAIGLLDADKVPDASRDIGLLLRQALEKVPALPWTLLVDKWRWGVYDGSVPADQYNRAWNDLRLKYMGVVPPVPRSEADFDPGAKSHVPSSVPYTRYYLARLLQFQFYQSACRIAGWQGPLHRCSFYGNKDVGAKLNAMLALGKSKPWPEALEAFTGTREMSSKPLVDYFAPLAAWLEEQNKGQECGW